MKGLKFKRVRESVELGYDFIEILDMFLGYSETFDVILQDDQKGKRTYNFYTLACLTEIGFTEIEKAIFDDELAYDHYEIDRS